jgi:hypothetical protein
MLPLRVCRAWLWIHLKQVCKSVSCHKEISCGWQIKYCEYISPSLGLLKCLVSTASYSLEVKGHGMRRHDLIGPVWCKISKWIDQTKHGLELSQSLCFYKKAPEIHSRAGPHQILFLFTCKFWDTWRTDLPRLRAIGVNFYWMILKNEGVTGWGFKLNCASGHAQSFSPCLPWFEVWPLSALNIERTCSTARNKKETGFLGLLEVSRQVPTGEFIATLCKRRLFGGLLCLF